MTVEKYVKKPVVIDALQWTGDNKDELLKFCDSVILSPDGKVHIFTLEGNMEASINDYIIKGVKGEFYPCKPDIFEATYEKLQ